MEWAWPIFGTVLVAVIGLLGTIYAARTNSRSAQFDSMAEAFEAITNDLRRVRNERDEALSRCSQLEDELARCYGGRRRKPSEGG